MDEEKYKSLLIVNESSDTHVTLYIYPSWDYICWLSIESKIIKPNDKYLHRSDKRFKFELVARFEDKRPKTVILLEPEMWVEDKLLKISESLDLTEGKLADFPHEKRVCVRKLQRDKELKSTNGRRNLYEILGLDMKQIRKMTKEEQVKAIKKEFRKQIQRWHPDRNFGDDEIAKEIIMAHEILLDEEKRARYHNEADYDEGWLSQKRYKAIFRPECFSEEQKRAYRDRMIMFVLSCGITIGGVVLTVYTAGLAAPALVTGAVFGGGLTGAGLQSLQHTAVNRKSVVDECNKKEWLLKAGIGFVGGAVIGGAAAGITAGVAGLGSAAIDVSAGQYVGIGAATVGGVASSLASDAGRKFVDGGKVTWKQVIGHALTGAVVGATAGVAGGAVTKSVVDAHTSAASANLEGEIGEQIVILTGARRLGNTLARNIPRMLTVNGTGAVMGTVAQFAEERLDDSVENQSPGEHLLKGAKNVARNAAIGLAKEGGGALALHASNEIKVANSLRFYKLKEHKTPLIDDETQTSVGVSKKHITRDKVRHDLSIEDNEHRPIKWRLMRATYKGLDTDEPSTDEPMSRVNTIFEEDDDVLDEPVAVPDPTEDGHIKYISDGAWISKMVVSYFLDGKEDTQEVSGSGKYVTIPSKARRIEVRFQVARPFWGDIKKYDRFKKCWCQPDQPHVFRYDTPPPLRTFTISGNLWWEAVMGVSDEYLADEDDPEEGQFKYISDGAWISKMIVSYFLDGKKHTQVVSGSGKYVTVPSKATRIEVRFQVARPFWGYIKKYDRFQRCWCQPDEPHVFRYDTPPSHRTFTISGNL